MTTHPHPRSLPAQIALLGLGLISIQAACWFVLQNPSALHQSWITTSVLFDLTLTAGGLFWFTMIRTGRLSRAALIPLLGLNILVARLLLPQDADNITQPLLILAGLAELGLALFTLTRLTQIRRDFRAASKEHPFEVALAQALQPHLPSKIPQWFALEVSLLRYFVMGWWMKPTIPDDAQTFTLHKDSGWTAIAMGFTFLILVEAIGGHLLLMQWNTTVATIHTILSLYGILWVIGDMHAIRLRPMWIKDNTLHVRVGLRWSAAIPLDHIQDAQRVNQAPDDEDALDVALPMGKMVSLTLDRPTTIQGFFATQRHTTKLTVSLDEPEAFLRSTKQKQ